MFRPSLLAIFRELSLPYATYASTYIYIPRKLKQAAHAKESSLKMANSEGRKISEHLLTNKSADKQFGVKFYTCTSDMLPLN